jgi:hypothetical protein
MLIARAGYANRYLKGHIMKPDEEYKQFMSMSTPELCAKIAQLEGRHTTTTLAQLALQSKQVEKQLRWMRWSAIITAVATLAAVVLGWCLSELRSQPPQGVDKPGITQSHTESSTSASHYERKSDKVPLQPSR